MTAEVTNKAKIADALQAYRNRLTELRGHLEEMNMRLGQALAEVHGEAAEEPDAPVPVTQATGLTGEVDEALGALANVRSGARPASSNWLGRAPEVYLRFATVSVTGPLHALLEVR